MRAEDRKQAENPAGDLDLFYRLICSWCAIPTANSILRRFGGSKQLHFVVDTMKKNIVGHKIFRIILVSPIVADFL